MTAQKRISSGRMLTALTSTMAAAAILAASAGAAQAADPQLLLSADGVDYAQSLARPIFGTVTGFVPGSSSTADIWIRNDNRDAAFLSVAALGKGPATELAADLGLTVHSTHGSTARVPVNGAGSCADLVLGWTVAPGESLRLTFTLDLDHGSSNATRRQSSSFDVRFLLEDQEGSTRRGACTSGGTAVPLTAAAPLPTPPAPVHGAPLAMTGVPNLWAWFLAAAAFLAAGNRILAYTRRNKAGSGSDDQK